MMFVFTFLLGVLATTLFFCWRTSFLLNRGFTLEEIHTSICGDMK